MGFDLGVVGVSAYARNSVRVVTEFAMVRSFVLLMALHTGIHANGALLKKNLPLLDFTMAYRTGDASFAMVRFVREIDELFNLINALPSRLFGRRRQLCELLHMRAFGLHRDVAEHALR